VRAGPEQVNRFGDGASAALQAPQPIAGAGNWELHIADNRLVWSEEIYKIFGVAQNSFPSTAKGFYSFIHPRTGSACTSIRSARCAAKKQWMPNTALCCPTARSGMSIHALY